MSYEQIKVEKKDHVTIVTINRPEVMNCVSPVTSVDWIRPLMNLAMTRGLDLYRHRGRGTGLFSG